MSVIPKIPRASGFDPLGPLPVFYPGPAGDLKRSPDPSPTHAPLTTNPESALEVVLKSKCVTIKVVLKSKCVTIKVVLKSKCVTIKVVLKSKCVTIKVVLK